MPAPTITNFVLGDYQTNCYVVTAGKAEDGSTPCWIVDCGLEPDEMLDWIEQQRLGPTEIILTHAHLDHIAGVDQALNRFGRVPVSIHEDEGEFCGNPMLNLSAMIGMPTTCTGPDRLLKDGDRLNLNGSTWRVLHTPGHSPGGICLVHDESGQAIVGDTLFAGSVGRSDFPTSDPEKLEHSLHEIILKLPDDMVIHPGHGPKTTIGRERRSNPFLVGGF
ncbi:MAG: MBL fold metallo-hydrolase [Phycisphaerales bacterium]|nr:MBL fold metallo-hydrolase [Phycisphaerales bacterium]MCI0629596.1 MBL fold metallo-hydrolase [Phycisphaerales bacterium]MCI0675134.1 MBL fold metallo-hydrolase [Phycisphaerales bacterium]